MIHHEHLSENVHIYIFFFKECYRVAAAEEKDCVDESYWPSPWRYIRYFKKFEKKIKTKNALQYIGFDPNWEHFHKMREVRAGNAVK